jgi:hypothetical protein
MNVKLLLLVSSVIHSLASKIFYIFKFVAECTPRLGFITFSEKFSLGSFIMQSSVPVQFSQRAGSGTSFSYVRSDGSGSPFTNLYLPKANYEMFLKDLEREL